MVETQYTDYVCCYKLAYRSFLTSKRFGRPGRSLDRDVPAPQPPYTWPGYGMISRWYAVGKTARARWSELDASASLSNTPWKTT